MTCKKIYTKLLSLRSKPPPTCEKRLLNFGYQKDDLRKLYLLPFEVTKEVKLSMFQYKIIHNILCTKVKKAPATRSEEKQMFSQAKRRLPMLPFLSSRSYHHTSFHWVHASYFVLEGVSGLGLAHSKLKIIAFNKRNCCLTPRKNFATCRTTRFKNSYFNRIVDSWNCLPHEVRF